MAPVTRPLGSLQLSVFPSVKSPVRKVGSKIPSALKMDSGEEEIFLGNTSWPYKTFMSNTDFLRPAIFESLNPCLDLAIFLNCLIHEKLSLTFKQA